MVLLDVEDANAKEVATFRRKRRPYQKDSPPQVRNCVISAGFLVKVMPKFFAKEQSG